MRQKEAIWLGLDVGNGSLVHAIAREGQGWHVAKTDSIFAQARRTTFSLGSTNEVVAKQALVYEGKPYVFGWPMVRRYGMTPIDTYDRDNRVAQQAYRLLVRLGVARAVVAAYPEGVPEEVHISLVLGTPTRDFTQSIVDTLHQWLGAQPITLEKPNVTITVDNMEVISQPIAAWLSTTIDEEGELQERESETTELILDMGAGTLDMSELMGLDLIDQTTISLGAHDVWQSMANAIRQAKPGWNVNKMDVADQWVKANQKGHPSPIVYTYHNGQTIDMEPFFCEAYTNLRDQLLGQLPSLFPDRERFASVLGFGGGILLFEEVFRDLFPALEIPNDPQLSIAMGLGRYCRYLFPSV